MNNYITGAAIRALREKNRLTQQQLAEKLCVSDKAISKWETGKGFPDISLIEPLANVLQVSIPELLSGEQIINTNRKYFEIQSLCLSYLWKYFSLYWISHDFMLRRYTASFRGRAGRRGTSNKMRKNRR